MENIFENAYFGKFYRTSNNEKVVYLRNFICNGHIHLVSNGKLEYPVNNEGKVDKNIYPLAEDIIGEW